MPQLNKAILLSLMSSVLSTGFFYYSLMEFFFLPQLIIKAKLGYRLIIFLKMNFFFTLKILFNFCKKLFYLFKITYINLVFPFLLIV